MERILGNSTILLQYIGPVDNSENCAANHTLYDAAEYEARLELNCRMQNGTGYVNTVIMRNIDPNHWYPACGWDSSNDYPLFSKGPNMLASAPTQIRWKLPYLGYSTIRDPSYENRSQFDLTIDIVFCLADTTTAPVWLGTEPEED